MSERKPDKPLVELIGSVMAEDDPIEQEVLIAAFELEYEVISRAELQSMLVSVARRNAEYERENRALRQSLNLPLLDSVDFAAEDDCE